jgi:pimeloyl-ACP methyl ester carboxylesterase
MPTFVTHDATTSYATCGLTRQGAPLEVVWAHGWGQDHRVFLGLVRGLEQRAAHTLIDFPGFGDSPPPPAVWGTADYADAVASFLGTVSRARRVWVGHSFGCRVGLQLAARHPHLVDGLFLIAAAGLPLARTPLQRLAIAAKVALYKALKTLDRLGLDVAAFKDRLGSADYRSAGPMRPVLVKAVREDLSDVARAVRCPVCLIYGALDTQTPPALGERLASLLPDAHLQVLPRLDHDTILTAGSHQVQFQLAQFMTRVAREPV